MCKNSFKNYLLGNFGNSLRKGRRIYDKSTEQENELFEKWKSWTRGMFTLYRLSVESSA